jgi:hypothetical protein
MIARLEVNARDRSLAGVEGIALPIEHLSLPAQSFDLVVTSYALHHLRDSDENRVVSAAYHRLNACVTVTKRFQRLHSPIPQPLLDKPLTGPIERTHRRSGHSKGSPSHPSGGELTRSFSKHAAQAQAISLPSPQAMRPADHRRSADRSTNRNSAAHHR